MKISSVELKGLIKRLTCVKGEDLILTSGGLVARDQDMTVCVASDKFSGVPNTSVDFRKFSAVTNRMSGELEITFGQSVVVKSGKAKAEMECKTPKPYVFTRPEELIELSLAPVKELLKYTSSAASTNKADSMFGGFVQFESTVKDNFDSEEILGFESMGTDGHKCAYESVAAPNCGKGAKFNYLIPLPAVAAIQLMDGKTLQFGETPSSYYLTSGATTVYANKLSKKFPNYRSFLPKTFKFTAVLDPVELKRVLHTVEPMVQEAEQYGVVFHFLDGRLNVKTVGSGGTAEDEMEYEADVLADVCEFTSKFNLKILTDYLGCVSTDITFNANSDKDPVILQSGNRNYMMAAVRGGTNG